MSKKQKTKKEKLMRIIFCIIVLALLLQGCGKKAGEKIAKKMIESAAARDGVKANVKISDDSLTIKTDKGQTIYSAGKSAKIPDNFPRDIYVYGDANVVAALTHPEGFSIVMETKDSQEKVYNTIKTKFNESGWNEAMTMSQKGAKILTYTKENKTVNIMITEEKKGSQINMTVALDKKIEKDE
jgi:outer membrane lipoprotein-sorting protein